MNYYVVTISRESGSGGRKIGKLLAEKLGWSLYDKELLEMAAKESGCTAEDVAGEEHAHSTHFGMAMSHTVNDGLSRFGMAMADTVNDELIYTMGLNDRLFCIESNLIRDIAKRENAVIVGRCADVALEENPNTLNIFIQGSKEKRIGRVMLRENLPREEAAKVLKRIDSTRAAYHDYYASTEWGKRGNYDLVINSDIGEEKAAAILYDYVTTVTGTPEEDDILK